MVDYDLRVWKLWMGNSLRSFILEKNLENMSKMLLYYIL